MADQSTKAELSPQSVAVFSCAAGIAVANLYYSQPLLAMIADSFHTSESNAGLVFAFTMAGYTTGLLFIVPLGDIFSKRKMILTLLFLVMVFLCAAVFSPGIHFLGACLFLLGAATVVPQILVPLAAGLASPARRGAVVGMVQSGLLIGILLSRTISGWVANMFGWRAVFLAATVATLMLVVVLFFRLPHTAPKANLSYPLLLKSLVGIFTEHSVLRTSCAFGAAAFAGFNIFWTNLSFFAAGPPFNYHPDIIGSFGLLGIAGCVGAAAAGRFADRYGGPLRWIGIALSLVAGSFALLYVSGENLAVLLLGTLVLDLGVQSNQVSNQTRIYSLPQDIHSRVNTIYMTSYFLGGSAGSAAGTIAWENWGWHGVCATGLVAAVMGMLFLFPALQNKSQNRSSTA